MVEHWIFSTKGCGFNSQGTHKLIKKKMYSLNYCLIELCKSLWIKASAKCINAHVNNKLQLCVYKMKIDSRMWVNFTRNGLRLGSMHQEPPHTDVSMNLATVVVRGVLPGLRRRTGL